MRWFNRPLGALIFCCPAFGLELPPDINLICPAATKKTLESLQLGGPWTRHVDAEPGVLTYRAPTKTFGRWLELRSDKQGNSDLVVVEMDKSRVIHFEKSCAQKSESRDIFVSPIVDDQFTDAKLRTIIESHDSGLIYIWSPKMIYSAKHLRQFADFCKKSGLHFTPVVSEWGTADLLEDVIARFKIKESTEYISSVELFMRGINHYPTAFVYTKGKLSRTPILGVMSDERLAVEVVSRISKL